MSGSPQLFAPPGSSTIAPGVNYRTVLQGICDAMNASSAGTCRPSPSQDDTIIILGGGVTVSVNVITADGNLRTNGGQAIAACEPGIQD